MNIILVSNNMAKARTLSMLQVSMIFAVLVFLSVLIAMLFIVPQPQDAQQGSKSLIPGHLRFSFNNPQKHLDAYALQLGELQARLMRLDAQSERLGKLAGEKLPESENPVDAKKALQVLPKPELASPVSSLTGGVYQGGPLVRSAPFSEAELQAEIAKLMEKVEFSTERLSSIEAKLLQQSVLKDTLPNSSPVVAAYNSSSYGWRIDPFKGVRAFHEGLDFMAAEGAPIYAAAGGIVTTARQSPDYGKIVMIDHGSGLETRYAHASKLLVRAGDRVEKGQKIAEVGSTGRSTGPHLHYEIRLAGNPLDPRKYLKASN